MKQSKGVLRSLPRLEKYLNIKNIEGSGRAWVLLMSENKVENCDLVVISPTVSIN